MTDTEKDKVIKIISRVGAGDIRYYLTIDYRYKSSAVWSGRFNTNNRLYLDSIVNVDFSQGMEAIKKKILLYLTFS